MLKRLLTLVAGLGLAFTVSAADLHRATPVEQLATSCHAKGHAATTPAEPVLATVSDDFNAAAAKVFNITARQFSYTVSPSPFVVNQGDSVTLNVTASDTTHGFQLEQYTNAFTINKGATRTITFVASTAGTFTYFCTVVCGDGHGGMNGVFTVNAVQQNPPPTITSVNPNVGPAKGGQVVTITGTNFVAGARVTFRQKDATAVDVQSSTKIVVTTPPNVPGSSGLDLINPDGQTASESTYTYIVPQLDIAEVTPWFASTAGGAQVTISGAGYEAPMTVTFDGRPATRVTVTSGESMTVVVPPGPFDFTGSKQVLLTLTRGSDGFSTTSIFTYSLPDPSIGLLSTPTASPAGGTPLTITGAGFTTALAVTVTVGGVPATNVTVVNAFTLSAVAPPHAAGAAPVIVTVGTKASSPVTLTYAAAPVRRRGARH